MKLQDHIEVLVAIGSAAAVNCQECLARLRTRATALAISPAEMAAAAQVGLRVGRSGADQTARFAATVLDPAAPADPLAAHHRGPAQADEHGCCSTSTEEGRSA